MTPISRDSVVFQKLLPISKKLHQLDEDYCNHGGNDHSDADEERLMQEASSIAEAVGLKAYHQSDPRGCSLYLIDETMNDTNYHNGMPVYEN